VEDDGITIGYKAGQARTTKFALQAGGNAAGPSLSISTSGQYAGSMEQFWCARSLLRLPPCASAVHLLQALSEIRGQKGPSLGSFAVAQLRLVQ